MSISALQLSALAIVALFTSCSSGTLAPKVGPGSVGDGHRPAPPASEARKSPPATVAVGNPKADLIPRNLLFGNPERANVQLSPDGRMLSWIAPKEGVPSLFVAPVDKLDQAKAVSSDTSRPIRSYFWAYTRNHIVYVQGVGGNDDLHLFRVDLADGRPVDLTPYEHVRAELLDKNHRFPSRLLVTLNDRNPQAPDVYEIDLLTAKRRLLVQNDEGFGAYSVDNDMKIRFASKRLPDGATQLFAPDGKQWKPFETIPFEDAETTKILGFEPGNKSVYVIDSRGRDTTALISLDLATRKRKVLAEDVGTDVVDTLVHPTKHTVQAVAFEYDRKRWKLLDESIEKDLKTFEELEGGEVAVGSRALDDKTWVVVTTTDQHPRRYYLWDRIKRQATFLFAAQPDLEKQPLVKRWPVEIESRDGLTLLSYLTLPTSADPDGDGKPNTSSPMVLLVHGGPWERDRWGYSPGAQLFANRGYAVLSVNFRGSTGFGKKFLNAANLQWSKKMHDDLIDAVGWAVKSGVALKDKICIAGSSYGGYAALVGLTITPELFRCGIDLSGPSNLHTFMASIPPQRAQYLGMLRARVGDPDTVEGKALLTAASPLTHAAKIRRPLLIGQGGKDLRVKQAESDEIVAAMKQLGLPVTYVVFPDEAHGTSRPENTFAFIAVTEAFLSAHLGGYYLPMTKVELDASSMQVQEGQTSIPGLPR